GGGGRRVGFVYHFRRRPLRRRGAGSSPSRDMYNLLIAFAAGVVVTVAVHLAGLPFYAGVVPGVLVFLGVYVLLARRIMKKLQALALAAQNELKSISSPRDQAPKTAKAIKTLEQGLALDKWQFMVAAQVHGQIGQLEYMVKD